MGEGSKQVRVDNWGVFFLQRLQTFFNKTDYCDLTLQFEGNVQLKVHRLVINACTEYFHILEETCETIDDVLIMPEDLQADVIVPIVNFMYTGMLEFHTSIFEKLYRTANLMNITVLTKLLDAQKSHMHPKIINKKSNHAGQTWSTSKKNLHTSNRKSDIEFPTLLPGRKLPVWKKKNVLVSSPVTSSHLLEHKRSESQFGVDNTPKPTRFEWPDEEMSTFNLFDSSFNEISYTSKPLLTQEDEPRPSTSFDRIKDLPDNNHKRSSNTYTEVNIDMNEVSDYIKEQKIRSTINLDTNEDDDDDADNDFYKGEDNSDGKRKSKFEGTPSKRIRLNINEKENYSKSTKINITPTGKAPSDDYHTKLISEVLKKYPNLVKKNKNIRLKILAKSNNSAQSTPPVTENRKSVIKKDSKSNSHAKTVRAPFIDEKGEEEGPWKCERCSTDEEPVEFVLYYLYRKHLTDVHNEKIDVRVCKYCGHKSSKYALLVYHQYTRHCISPPSSFEFPKCDECPYIAPTVTFLLRHKQNHNKNEIRCAECFITFTNQHTLTSHVQITGHTGRVGKTNFDCQYCVKKFPSGFNLFAHIRLEHRVEARRDGIVSIDEFDEIEQGAATIEEEEVYISSETQPDKKEKIKILQDVKLANIDLQERENSISLEQQNVSLEPSSEAEALSNVASGIATSLGLVDVVVLDENQQYILHTADNQQTITSAESEFILPSLEHSRSFTANQQTQNVITQSMLGANIGSTDELVMVLTDHDYNDGNNDLINNENSNIVVLYSHPIEGQENQFITTTQGNLMLTSQAGLIELRNGNTVVTSAQPHFIATTPENQDNQIESIEMIQREINQHPNVKNNMRLVQDQHVPEIIDESTTLASEIPADISDDSTAIEAQPAATILKDDLKTKQQLENNELRNSESTVNQSAKVDSSEINSQQKVELEVTKSLQTMESNDDITDKKLENDKINTDTNNIEQKCSNEITNNENIDTNNENTDINNENTDINNENIDTSSKDNVDININSENNILEEINDANKKVSEDLHSHDNIDGKNVEEEEDIISNKTEEVETCPSPLENTSTEKITEAESQDSNLECSTVKGLENETENKEYFSEKLENEKPNELEQCSVEINNKKLHSDKIVSNSQSAKTILDDWDDTDSQQSDSKVSGTNVNKLIDDWDDEEDDNK